MQERKQPLSGYRIGDGPVVIGSFTTEEWRMLHAVRAALSEADRARGAIEEALGVSEGRADPKLERLRGLMAAEEEATAHVRKFLSELTWPTLEQLDQLDAMAGVRPKREGAKP